MGPGRSQVKAITGIRPTGPLHLGHYFSVIRPGLEGAYVLIASYHAPGERHDIEKTLRSFAIKNIIRQEEVFDAPLYFRLLAAASLGPLQRMTQFKVSREPTAHLLTYPVLMAHDVANFDEVFVGEDQKQHLEYASDLLRKVGLRGPQARVVGGRIKSLTDPSQKMSKSQPGGCLFLEDTALEAHLKLRRAVTTPEGRQNLVDIYKGLGGQASIPEMNSELKAMILELFLKLRSL